MSNSRRDEHSERRDRLIAALLSTPTHDAAATAAGVSVATIQRYLRQQAFQKAYRSARNRLVEVAIGQLQQVAGKAVDTLERNLTCGRPGDEVRAAVAILEHAYRGVEALDVADRLAQIEQALRVG